MTIYISAFIVFMLSCLAIAEYNYLYHKAPSSTFFYHELVKPFKQHAIQVSILGFIGLGYLLLENKGGSYSENKLLLRFTVCFLTLCIWLLSSKLVIIFAIILFIVALIKRIKNRGVYKIWVLPLICTVFLVLTMVYRNPVSQRFNEIISGNIEVVKRNQFSPAMYFNGLQFRILQLRFVTEILNEHHAWAFGVADDAQKYLNEKYIASHMYIGENPGKIGGFINYNTHNQFLQSTLQAGVAGLAAFALLSCGLFILSIKRKRALLLITVLLLICYSLNESVLERQYSIFIFFFFPLMLYYTSNKPEQTSSGFAKQN